MGLRRTSEPTNEPVTLAEAKLHLRVDHDEEDDMIRQYVKSARAAIEEYTRRAVITQTWQLTLPDFPQVYPFEIVLPLGRVSSVTSIAYTDSDGNPQTLTGPSSGSPAGTGYQEDLSSDEQARLRPPVAGEWPSVQDEAIQPVTVTFVAGYGADTKDVPDSLRTAVLYQLTDLYEFRGAIDGIIGNARKLASPYRLTKFE